MIWMKVQKFVKQTFVGCQRLDEFAIVKLKAYYIRRIYMPIYNKLVRDRIPEIIEQAGKKYETKILDDKLFVVELRKKLREEMQEYFEAVNDEDALEELADILELMHALAKVHGDTIDKVEEIRRQKAQKRGGFDEKIFLIEVENE